MKRLLGSCLAVAMLLGVALAGAPQARAADVEMVGAFCHSGYDGTMADLDLLGEMIGRPELHTMAEGMIALATQGRGIEGFDKTRPWGILVGTDGTEVGGCAFIPVTDMKAAMGMLKSMAKDKMKECGGHYEIAGPKKTVYVQETHKGWAFVVDNPDLFQYVPANPVEVLGGLNEQYSVAVRMWPAKLPDEVRRDMAEKAKKHAERHMQRRPCENDRQFEARKLMAGHIRKHLAIAARDLEEMTIGWKLDSSDRKGVLEAVFVAKEGSDTAHFLAPAAETHTAFGGFALADATLTLRGTGRTIPLPDAKLDDMFDGMREKIFKKIDAKASADDAEVVKDLVDDLLPILRENAGATSADGAVSVRLAPEAITLLNARQVADGAKIEALVKKAVGAAGDRCPDVVDRIVKLDAAKVGRTNLHLVSVPLDECPHGDALSGAVGEKLEIVLGFGPKAAYLAAGRNAMDELQKALRKSRKARDKVVPPMAATLDLGALATSAAACPSEKVNPKGKKALELLEGASGDEVRFTVEAVDRGLKLCLELDEGALKLLAECPKHKRK